MRYSIQVEIFNILRGYEGISLNLPWSQGVTVKKYVLMFSVQLSLHVIYQQEHNVTFGAVLWDLFLTEGQKESLTAKRTGQVPFLLLSFSSSEFP